jgi:hypothetical protein
MKFVARAQDLTWFRDKYRDGDLVIKPPFQRKAVWKAKQKCFLIESMLMKLPIPEVYLQRVTTEDGKTKYAVVDGQQRMRTLFQFVGAELDKDEAQHNGFALDELKQDSNWKNKTFADLKPDEKVSLWGYEFGVRFLDTGDDDAVRDLFARLNRYGEKLRPQELRHAMSQGPFAKLSLKLADDPIPGKKTSYWAENGIISAASIRRMADVEFVSDLLIGIMDGPQGGSAAVLDEYYEKFEGDEGDEFPGQRQAEKLFAKTLGAVQAIFPDINRVPRWGNKTDFYSLFVALGDLLRERDLAPVRTNKAQKALIDLANAVDERLANEKKKASPNVIEYARAVEKGANDKPRRGARHEVLTDLLRGFVK